MGPGAHLLHYPIAGGRLINFLAVIEGPARWTAPAWMETAAPGAHLCGLHRLASGRRPNAHSCAQSPRWGLFTLPPLTRWSRSPVVLLGDAAHAMLSH
jgi:salicylate hydroxylase